MTMPAADQTAYAPMRARAAAFGSKGSWFAAAMALAVLWYGFDFVFLGAIAVWAQTEPVRHDPSLMEIFFEGSTPAAVRWTLASFAIYTLLLALVMRFFHGLAVAQLIGPQRTAAREFGRVCLYLLPLYGLLTLPTVFAPDVFAQFSFGRWLTLLPATLPLLFIQISAEELVFRGYLQSHLAALSRHPVIWIGIPSVLFGLIHYDPTSPAYTAWAYVVWAACLGVVCADLTARSGTLGPALAVHFINNISALLIVAADDWLYGAALYVWPANGQAWEPWVPYEALVLLCVWLCARLAVRR